MIGRWKVCYRIATTDHAVSGIIVMSSLFSSSDIIYLLKAFALQRSRCLLTSHTTASPPRHMLVLRGSHFVVRGRLEEL